ncbi:DUF4174 domain-containing protein [Kozakia baliensis]|uniref:Uncharacterized protein n=1 Tax=Kozakia baliensis TaxID=153496 RepID=A0A1D8UQQ6_9PROT|nr:DUF4174 domain-containing protein [Kozakia baliensis]AOX15964.1 hypothetical protein A0U89_01135 [Kozakia baliensis]AOX21051.1 hypothetical protein A0U90_13050 [Kozakia baliensis]GBR27354.1 hypothetical protein AA0488_1114 [Kozakia baliensis NRIC 0488]GEL64140.1 hypothetical protein KBA01_14260 [Kozakia baliensis]
MRRWFVLSAFLIVFGAFWGCASESLRAYQWHNRIVLVFADSEHDPQLRQQKDNMEEDPSGLRERDLTVIAIIGQAKPRFWRGEIRHLDNRTLRNEYGVALGTGFALRLIGKDGGTKWRSSKPVPLENIYGVIDAMPMRRAGEH